MSNCLHVKHGLCEFCAQGIPESLATLLMQDRIVERAVQLYLETVKEQS